MDFFLLGAPIGPAEFCNASTMKRLDNISTAVSRLHDLKDSQMKITLLRSCLAMPKFNFSPRSWQPLYITSSTKAFDNLMGYWLTLNWGLRYTCRWVFIITDVSKAIFGADFLKHYHLSVDMKACHLLDPLTHLKVQGIASSVTSSLVLSLLSKPPKSDYQKILIDFPTITSPYNGNVQIKHDVTLHIETRDSLYSLNPDVWPWVTKDHQARVPAHVGTRNYQAILK